MKNLMIASAIALMCLGTNAFAEDDGYGNDIPPARVEGTVDDGYGNKLPANEPEYKSYGDARASSNSGSPDFNIGFHFAFGACPYLDYPTDSLVLDHLGENEWTNFSFDLGAIFKYRIHRFVSIAPEVNLGINIASRDKGRGFDWYYGPYQVSEQRVLFSVNIPLMLRFTPIPSFYIEGGARVNFNLGTTHSYEYYDPNGEQLRDEYEQTISKELEEWKAKTFVPSVIGGLGGTFKVNGSDLDFGLRVIYDLSGIEADDKIDFFDKKKNEFLKNEKGEKVVVNNDTRMLIIQLVLNYYAF